MKPHINAIYVESVTAFGKKTTLLAIFKLGQANCAFERFLVGLGGEDENRERAENGGVKAAGGGGGGGVGVEGEAGASAAWPPPADKAAAGVDVEEEDEDDGAEEDDDGAKHDFAA